ncbi:MAG TPA: DUF3429 domain-containing protein [Pseudolabrys sp.]|nr:DUF3429 domain-containing protein [Pseudolabrys sp.]
MWLGALGILPFLGLSVVAWVAPENLALAAVEAVVAYGAVIVSFIGGALWGFASHHLTGKQATMAGAVLAVSVLPSLVGWLALLLPTAWSVALLSVAFAAVLGLDHWVMSIALAPRWWMRLRLPLSATVATLLLLTFFAVVVRLGGRVSGLSS